MSFFEGINSRYDIPKLYGILDARNVCEVGVLWGKNLDNMSKGHHRVLCFGVDTWGDSEEFGANDAQRDMGACYKRARSLMNSRRNVVLLRVPSLVAAGFFPDGFFDLIYIDANHVYDRVKEDMGAWWPKVRTGGVLSGHDYMENEINGVRFGVIEAVNEFIARHMLDLHVTTDQYPSWMVVK